MYKHNIRSKANKSYNLINKPSENLCPNVGMATIQRNPLTPPKEIFSHACKIQLPDDRSSAVYIYIYPTVLSPYLPLSTSFSRTLSRHPPAFTHNPKPPPTPLN